MKGAQPCLFIPSVQSPTSPYSLWGARYLVAAGEAAPPSSAPAPGTGDRKKTLVLVIVALLVIAALASVTYYLLSRTSSPVTPPAVRLDHVTISGGTSVDQAGLLTLSAVAIDTNGAAETSNATWLWSASPTASVTVVTSGTPS